jgi:hypothetical protein
MFMYATIVIQGTNIGGGFIQVPSGWTPINQITCGSGLIESNSYRIAAPPDVPGKVLYTWSFCTSAPCTGSNPLTVAATGSVVSYSDISQTMPLQTGTGAPECDCHFGTTATANGLTPTADNSLVIAQHAAFGNVELSGPAGYTSIFEHSNTFGPDNRQSFNVQTTPTATGPVSSNYKAVSAPSTNNIGCLISANQCQTPSCMP